MSRLIGLVGRAQSGKDTVGQMIQRTLQGDQRHIDESVLLMSFAGPLKKICGEVFDFSYAQLNGDQKEQGDERYRRADGTFLTPREAMQKLGTEWGRACYPEVWVDLALRLAKVSMARGDSIVFTDCRFLNEAKAICLAGGQVWRIYRKSADTLSTHPSETEMNSREMDELYAYRISNDGTLEELRAEVDGILSNKYHKEGPKP